MPGAPEIAGYELPGDTVRRREADFERFLAAEGLAGDDRLAVSVLVIREQLDEAGLVREVVLERRRGGAEGPYYGKVARVEFAGAAVRVRRYQASADGRLAELPVEDDPGPPPPPDDPEAESFAGEDAAVHAYAGPGCVILDRRAPSLFEDMAGLSGIIHVRRRDGGEAGFGVGWHGGTAFVIAADFPRHGRPLAAPPDLDAAVEAALPAENLIRFETRIDERGFCVIARHRGGPSLVSLRLNNGQLQIEPYLPGRTASANEDQRRWMSFVETYEARTVLDSWRNGDEDEIAVLTVDPDDEAWRHVIDADGIELRRRPDNEAAAAVLWRERIGPLEMAAPESASLEPAPPDPSWQAGPPPAAPDRVMETVLDDRLLTGTAPADSLLAKVSAYLRAIALLRAAAADPARAMARLSDLAVPLQTLNARLSLGLLDRLLARDDAMTAAGLAAALDEFAVRLRDDLTAVRIAELPSARRRLTEEAPFGPMVEALFPSAAYDIEEAVQCLALLRSTAAVSHAAKVMGHGLRAAGRLLDTPDLAEMTWPRLIAAARAAAGEEHRALLDALVQVRRAWRGPALVPADKYTVEEAEAVLEAVAVFMRAVAAAFDARGESLAE